MKPYLQNTKITDEVLLEKNDHCLVLKQKEGTEAEAKMTKVETISEGNEDVEKGNHANKPISISKKCEMTKRDTLMEKIDQGNEAICEAIHNLTHQSPADLYDTNESEYAKISIIV